MNFLQAYFMHLSMSSPRGEGVGHRVGILTFSKKSIKIPTPGQRIIVKISRNKFRERHGTLVQNFIPQFTGISVLYFQTAHSLAWNS